MKSIGYAGASLFRCKYGNTYSLVMAAPDQKTAREAFILFLNDRGHKDTLYSHRLTVKATRTVGKSDIFWAQVDMKKV